MEPLITEIRVPALPDFVGIVRFTLSGLLARTDFNSEEVEDIKVAVSEACTNVVQYAYPKKSKKGTILVNVAEKNHSVEITVTDTGVGFNPAKPPRRKLHDDDIHMGLGIVFMRNLMDKVDIISKKNKGTKVVLLKKIKA